MYLLMPPVKSEIMKAGLFVATAHGIIAKPASANRVIDMAMAVMAGNMTVKIMVTEIAVFDDESGGRGRVGATRMVI